MKPFHTIKKKQKQKQNKTKQNNTIKLLFNSCAELKNKIYK